MEDQKIKLTIRQSNSEQFTVEISPKATVMELKQACVDGCKLPAESQRLIFKGRILKDESTLDEYKIEDGLTVHLVKGKSAQGAQPQPSASTGNTSSSTTSASEGQQQQNTSSSTNNAQSNPQANPFAAMGGMGGMGGFGGMGGMGGFPNMMSGGGPSGMGGMGNMDPQMINSMMNNPAVQQMLSNPEFMNQMINSNPMLQQMCQQNPMVRQILTNPEMMRSMMTPQNLAAAQSMMNDPNAMNNMGSMGGGANPFTMPGMQQNQGATNNTNNNAQQQPNPFQGMDLSAMMGGMGNQGMNMDMLNAMMGGGAANNNNSSSTDSRPAREKYAEQLAQIKEMGFNDEEVILKMLEDCNGNVNLALEKLFNTIS